VIAGQGTVEDRFHDASGNPLVAPPAQGCCGNSLVGDAEVGASADQHLHELVDVKVIGRAQALTAERMLRLMCRQQG
jgi:hypothetical protein